MNHTSQVMICVCVRVAFFVLDGQRMSNAKSEMRFPDAGGGTILEGIHEFYWYSLIPWSHYSS